MKKTHWIALLLTLAMLLVCMPQALAEEVVVLEEPIAAEEAPEIIEEVIVEDASEVENGDVAEVAGCTHPEEALVPDHEFISDSAVRVNVGDPDRHRVYGDICMSFTCSICGEWVKDVPFMTFDENDNSKRYFEEHKFVDNVCSLCGYIKVECQHPAEEVDVVYQDLLVGVFEPLDDVYHENIAWNGYRHTCKICGHTWMDLGERYSLGKEEHKFVNGICQQCAYTKSPGQLTMSELTYEIAEGKHFFIDKPAISGGTGNYTIAYNIYDDQGNAVNYFYEDAERVAASPWANGRYNVFVVVRDGVSEVQKDIGWHELSGY